VDGAGFLRAVNASDALLPVFTSVELMMMQSQNRRLLSGHFLPVSLGALLMTAWIGASPASGQSFDCRNARFADEKTICREAGLGQLDKDLAGTYDRAGKKLSKKEREDFENNETAFVNARHRCGENLACIEQSYRNRLQELQTLLPDGELDRSEGRAASTKRRDRQKASTPDRENPDGRAKIESERTEAKETKPAPTETTTPSAERKTEPTEPRPAAALPPAPATALPAPAAGALPSSPPAEARSRHKARASTGSTPLSPAGEARGVAKPAPAETATQSSEPKSNQTEVKPAAALPSPSAEPRSRHKEHETVNTGSMTLAPPSKEEARAALEGAAVPEKRSRHEKRNRHKDSVSTVSAKPAPASEQEKQPTSPAAAIPEQHMPATGSSTASVQPASPPEKRRSKSKKVATGTSGTPAPSNPPAEQARPPEPAKPAGGGGTNWVNPPPSR
jgi:uncharacterized protein